MKKWIINAGKHYSMLTWSNLLDRLGLKFGCGEVTYKFNFDSSCLYPKEDADSMDINKLAGFSFARHHDNSVRIGWRPHFDEPGKIELFFYMYNESKRIIQYFTIVEAGKDYTVKISFDKNDDKVFFFLTDDMDHQVKRWAKFKMPGYKSGYYLWFYFGGNKPAPQDMMVSLKKV